MSPVNNLFDTRSDSSLSGSPLRNEAADYLRSIYGNAQLEVTRLGKKVDVLCRVMDFGKETELFVEVKDYGRNLGRDDITDICVDYEPLLGASPSSRLLIVTRGGLSSSGQESVKSRQRVFHQTIWEMEDAALALLPYVRAQADAFDEGGLSSYYVPARAHLALYDENQTRTLADDGAPLLEIVEQWLEDDDYTPIAILGGYGAGKSSFARRVLARQAARALESPAARRPILVKLGGITRSSGLDSLLGSLFTSEYEVRGYSFRRFRDLNEKGRLLIILDGFDEMKHAMNWTEFKNEINELNALNAGKSKILLLGRPSAFTSDDEHLEVLRGRLRTEGGGTTKLHGWPEFREFELAPFTREERADFVTRYLRYAATGSSTASQDQIEQRIAEVNLLADQEPDVFGKPVHARILVELALDHEFDLSTFAGAVTRWTLYSQFFLLLARRETEKPARSPIEARFRLDFLRELALWLWQDRDGATSFRAPDIPASIFEPLPAGDAETIDDKRREYLAGAFLERKANDNYFFPHRSFAEFLVSERLAMHAPQAHEHGAYANLVTGGVAEFLDVAPASRCVADWCATLDRNSGALPIDYLLFLVDRAGGYSEAANKLAPDSCWRPLLEMFGSVTEDLGERHRVLSETILGKDRHATALLLTSITRFNDLVPYRSDAAADQSPLVDLTIVAAAALITKLVRSLREKEPGARHTIREADDIFLRLAQTAMRLESTDQGRTITFSWARLGKAAAELAGRAGPDLVVDAPEFDFQSTPDERLPYFQVRQVMPPKESEFFNTMVLRRGGLDQISIVSETDRRRV